MISESVTIFQPQDDLEVIACHKIKLKEIKMNHKTGRFFICPIEKSKVVTERLKDILLELRNK
jgi:hypothetical protein